MSVTVYWKAADRPAIGAMATTTRLTDGAIDDTTTGETASETINFGAGCAYYTARAYVTAVVDLGALYDLATWRFTCHLTGGGGPHACDVDFGQRDPNGFVGTAAIEISNDGVTWTPVAAPAVIAAQQTITGTFADGTVGRYVRLPLLASFEVYDDTDFVTATTYLSDFRVSGTPIIEDSIAQCQTRTFATNGTHATHAFLWEVWLGSVLIDYADRYDRFGHLGWGVLLPGLSGGGSLTLTAPGDALVAMGYTARSAGVSVDFEVTTGGCPDNGGGPKVADKIIFSTGTLFVYPVLAAVAVSRIAVGAPPAAVNPLANATDGNPATLLDLTYTNGTNYQYAQLDYGSAQTISALLLSNVTSLAALNVYASATAITDGNMAGATPIPLVAGAQPANGAPLRFELANAVSARYLYIVPGAAATMGEVDGRGRKTPFGVVQNAALTLSYSEAVLRGPCFVSEYPVADAQFDFAGMITAEWASFDPRAAEILAGANMATVGSTTVNTATLTSKPQRFTVEFTTQSVDGKNLKTTAYDCVAPGMTWKFGRDAFALLNFVAKIYQSINTGVPWKIEEDL